MLENIFSFKKDNIYILIISILYINKKVIDNIKNSNINHYFPYILQPLLIFLKTIKSHNSFNYIY